MAIETQPATKAFRCDYCEGAIEPSDLDRAEYSSIGTLNNPAGRFFSEVTATVHLCVTCRGVVTVESLDSLLADELANVIEEQREKFFPPGGSPRR